MNHEASNQKCAIPNQSWRTAQRFGFQLCVAVFLVFIWTNAVRGDQRVFLLEVPDYSWFAGCFGTGSGNLMGYWDRNGFPDMYTGPTGGGLAPLGDKGENSGIRSLWATMAGMDGRPLDKPGHIDDYWTYYHDEDRYSYQSTQPDPYTLEGREEHAPDCLGDFIGLSQNKWTSLNEECDGNIDAFSFVFWDKSGERRWNFTPPELDGDRSPDIPSGLRKWTQWRGYQADVFSQLTDFNPNCPEGKGFGFEDLKAEIDAGYPVLLFMQRFDTTFRSLQGMERANPNIHGMLACGYFVRENGQKFVQYRTSWRSGTHFSVGETASAWTADPWQTQLPIRGVIGYRPKPQIRTVEPVDETLHLTWHGPSATLTNATTRTAHPAHYYVVEHSSTGNSADFAPLTDPAPGREASIPMPSEDFAFFRVKLLSAKEVEASGSVSE